MLKSVRSVGQSYMKLVRLNRRSNLSTLKNEETKLLVIELDKEGLSGRQIEQETGVPRSTVGDFLRRESWMTWWQDYDKEEKVVVASPHSDRATKSIRGKDKGCEDNSRVLLISDMHIPYHHKDTMEFLAYLKEKYNPTRVICLGDEVDGHALSYHDSDPDLMSAGDELKAALPVIAQIQELFPVMDILDSNHGSLVWRKAKTHGIPKQYIRSYNEVLGVGSDWVWHNDMTITLPDGNKCYLHHGKSNNVTRVSQTMGMCTVQGHYHEILKVDYWGNPNGLYWALQSGCLIDDESYAFSYNNVNLKRPVIGTSVIIDSHPVLEPMVLDEEGRWVLRKK